MTNWAAIRGFNYQPSYGSSGFEIWTRLRVDVVREELDTALALLPGFNAVRVWLSWDAYVRDPAGFVGDFHALVAICRNSGLLLMPVLFNRWHSPSLDWGGIYLDQFLPGAMGGQSPDDFDRYVDDIVGSTADNPTIVSWDLCNEPYGYVAGYKIPKSCLLAEEWWLKRLAERVRQLSPGTPITIGTHSADGVAGLQRVAPICDVLSIHPYWIPSASAAGLKLPPAMTSYFTDGYLRLLDEYVTFAAQESKPLLATETCWGAVDDRARSEIVEHTLEGLAGRGIGWLAYALVTSRVADCHQPTDGPGADRGSFAFIDRGALRDGHDVVRRFM